MFSRTRHHIMSGGDATPHETEHRHTANSEADGSLTWPQSVLKRVSETAPVGNASGVDTVAYTYPTLYRARDA